MVECAAQAHRLSALTDINIMEGIINLSRVDIYLSESHRGPSVIQFISLINLMRRSRAGAARADGRRGAGAAHDFVL